MGCVSSVPEDQIVFLRSFGKFLAINPPGLLITCPMCREVDGHLSTRVMMISEKTPSKTADSVFLHVEVTIMYAVDPKFAYQAFYELNDPTGQIRSNVSDVVRGRVPNLKLDELFESKDDLAADVKKHLQEFMQKYGFITHQVLVTDIDPDLKNRRAMNEINVNARLREAKKEMAEADKILAVKRAEADAESKYLMGIGVAAQRRALVDGLKNSVMDFSAKVDGMQPKDVLELVLVTQYFDALKEIAGASKEGTLLFPHNPSALRDLSSDIRRSFSGGA